MTDDDDWQRLADLVVARRRELGLRTQKSLGQVMGAKGPRTVNDIEAGRRSSYDKGTIADLERALGWETGSVRKVLAGGSPDSARKTIGQLMEEGATPLTPEAASYVSSRDRAVVPLADASLDLLLEEIALRARGENPDA